MRIAVIAGGPSLERDISLAAGDACAKALQSLGYETALFDASRGLATELAGFAPDVAFNALHGRWGEDGCLQGLLEWLQIPYTHSGVAASAIAMDKVRCKRAFKAAGVPVADSILCHRDQIAAGHVMAPPYIVKPHNEGSSLGGFALIESDQSDPPSMPADAREFFMVETYIPGRELTAGVMDGKGLTVSEFMIGAWYDYGSKYELSETNRKLPANLPDDVFAYCLELAERAHAALGCRGISRTDFRWDESRGGEGLIALEINTQPGLRPDSNIGQQAALLGIDFPELCKWLVDDAGLNRDDPQAGDLLDVVS